MHITLVKKILADGIPCKKCTEVQSRLEKDGYIDCIDHVAIADEREPNSEGMQLAKQYQVERAPFFILEEAGKPTKIYTIYFQFVKEVLKAESNEQEEAKEILKNNPDLDFL